MRDKRKKTQKAIRPQDLTPKKEVKGGLIGLLGANRGQLPAVQHAGHRER